MALKSSIFGSVGRRSIALMILACGASSCIPATSAQFEASAKGGDIGASSCAGGEDAVSFAPSDLEHAGVSVIGVAPRAGGPARIIIKIGKTGPGGLDKMLSSSATYDAWEKWFLSPMTVEVASRNIDVVWANGGHETVQIAFPGGGTSVVTNDRYNHFFSQRIVIPNFSGDWLEVRLPAMTFDGHRLAPAPIRFELVTRTRVSPINC